MDLIHTSHTSKGVLFYANTPENQMWLSPQTWHSRWSPAQTQPWKSGSSTAGDGLDHPGPARCSCAKELLKLANGSQGSQLWQSG